MATGDQVRNLYLPSQLKRSDILWDDEYPDVKGMMVMSVRIKGDEAIIRAHRDGREMKSITVPAEELIWVRPNG